MVEARESVNRGELLQKLSWVLGIDRSDMERLESLEMYDKGVEVKFGYHEKVYVPWLELKRRKGVGSTLAEQHHRADEVDQLQLIHSDE